MIYLVLILCVAVAVIDCYLTAKIYKEFEQLLELIERQSNTTTTTHLDRAREGKIEYRNKNNNNWPKID